MLWTVQLLNMSGGSEWLGFVWIGISTAIAFGSFQVRKLINPTMGNISVMYLVIVIPMLLASLGQSVLLVLAGFCLHEIGRGAERHILTTYADHHIPNEYRATLNSARSGSRWLGGAFGLFLIFLLGSAGIIRQPQQFWLFSTLIIAFLGLYAICSPRRVIVSFPKGAIFPVELHPFPFHTNNFLNQNNVSFARLQ